MKSLYKVCLAVLLATFLLWSPNGSAFADDDFNGYSVSKMIIDTKGKPGDTIQQGLEVYNHTGKAVKVKVDIRDFDFDGKQIHYKTDLPPALSVSKWSSVQGPE